MISGAVATLIHDAISSPTDVIKQRMQMYNSPYTSVVSCVRDIYKREGFKAFYRAYGTQLVMNLPYQTIHFTTYEFFQNKVSTPQRTHPFSNRHSIFVCTADESGTQIQSTSAYGSGCSSRCVCGGCNHAPGRDQDATKYSGDRTDARHDRGQSKGKYGAICTGETAYELANVSVIHNL